RSPDESVDARFHPLTESEDCALILVIDLFNHDALDAAMRDIADQHLAAVRAVRNHHGLARRVADLILRHPDDRRIGGVPAVGGQLVPVEATLANEVDA